MPIKSKIPNRIICRQRTLDVSRKEKGVPTTPRPLLSPIGIHAPGVISQHLKLDPFKLHSQVRLAERALHEELNEQATITQVLNQVRLAALNNALWCEEMCCAHGQPTEITERLWICRGTPPRYHSSLTTLQPDSREAVQREMPGGFKDGFYDIDATELGYKELFRASWIWRDPSSETKPNLEWQRVQRDAELLDWETSWAAGDDDAANHPRQFPPCLLEDPSNAFLGGYQNGIRVAGCILNVTKLVVGISNAFVLDTDLSNLWHDLPLVANETFPDVPMVGYERGQDLEAALAVGFQAIGDLRVWVKA